MVFHFLMGVGSIYLLGRFGRIGLFKCLVDVLIKKYKPNKMVTNFLYICTIVVTFTNHFLTVFNFKQFWHFVLERITRN